MGVLLSIVADVSDEDLRYDWVTGTSGARGNFWWR
jgi:hypothetical protein